MNIDEEYEDLFEQGHHDNRTPKEIEEAKEVHDNENNFKDYLFPVVFWAIVIITFSFIGA